MANKVIRSNMTEEELKHYGVIGMKWGAAQSEVQNKQDTAKSSYNFETFRQRLATRYNIGLKTGT